MGYVFERHDGGTPWEDDGIHGGLRDELAFERHYHQPYAVVVAQDRRRAVWLLTIEQQRDMHERAVAAAEAKGEEPPPPFEEPEVPDDVWALSEWITFLAWVRMRRNGATDIPDDFEAFVDAVKGWHISEADEADDEAEIGEDGSRLDPTDQEAAPTSSRSSFSSPVSTGAPS